MARRKTRARRRRRPEELLFTELEPFFEWWLSLTPAERLRRSWRLRKRIKNLQAVHDAKSLPEP
jgi:hypothetical protein